MTPHQQWAQRWRLPPQALTELAEIDTQMRVPQSHHDGAHTERGVSDRVRLALSREGCVVMRNNVGAFQDDTGRWIRYGLANDSAALNKRLKSSDLVGIRPVVITPAHVGTVIGQFLARECKRPGWKYTGNERERAQLAFIELVAKNGGDAGFTS